MNYHSLLIVIVTAVVTAFLRFLPFLIFGGKRKIPEIVLRLGKMLPCAVMGMLVVYCLKDISFFSFGSFFPPIAASGVVVLLHILKKNSLLSIVGGTAVYMILIHII